MAVPTDKRIDPSSNRRSGSKDRDAGGKKCSVPTAFCCSEVDVDAISKADACSMVVAALLAVPEAPKFARTTRIEETRINTQAIVITNLIKLLDIRDSFPRKLSRWVMRARCKFYGQHLKTAITVGRKSNIIASYVAGLMTSNVSVIPSYYLALL